jgi:hypothetical protein
VAVPVKGKARSKHPVQPEEPVDAPVVRATGAPAQPADRFVRSSPTHRYRVGQQVRVLQPSRLTAPIAGLYRVVRLMPYEGQLLQYRLRSEENHSERVVSEANMMLPAEAEQP